MKVEWLAVEGDAAAMGDVAGDVGVGDLVDEDVVRRRQGNEAGQYRDDTDGHHPDDPMTEPPASEGSMAGLLGGLIRPSVQRVSRDAGPT